MPRIKMDSNGIKLLNAAVKLQTQNLQDVERLISRVASELDLQIAATENISQNLRSLSFASAKQRKKLEEIYSTLQLVADDFVRADQNISNQARDINYLADTVFLKLSNTTPAMGLAMASTLANLDNVNSLFGITASETIRDPVILSRLSNGEGNLSESGKAKEKSLLHLQSDDGYTDINFRAIGYEKNENSVEAYLAKFTTEEKVSIAGIATATTIGITGLAVRGEASAAWDFFDTSKKSDIKEGYKVKGYFSDKEPELTEYDGTPVKKDSFNLVSGVVSAEVGATVATIDYKTEIGDDMLGGSVGANVKLLDADAGASAGIKLGDEGLAVFGKAEVGASLAEVEGSASVKIAGVEAKTTVSAEIGFGASVEAGWNSESREFTFGIGASLGVGGKIKFKIKIPKLW